MGVETIGRPMGIVGYGEVDSNPMAAKGCIEGPFSHTTATGLAHVLIGEDPLRTEYLWHPTTMALLRRRTGDQLPASAACRWRSGDGARGLHGDEACDPDRRPRLDHGVEIGIWQDGLKQDDPDRRLTANRPLLDHPTGDDAALHLGHLQPIFGAVGDGHALFAWLLQAVMARIVKDHPLNLRPEEEDIGL